MPRNKNLTRLKSSHVVQMIADGVDESGPYMIFEWVDGTDLEQVLSGVARKENPLPLNQAILIGYYLAQGLSYLHNLKDENGKHLGLIHRDLSPGNVLISNQGDVKIADFGTQKASSRKLKPSWVSSGKFAYMAPDRPGQAMDHRRFCLGYCDVECCMAQSLLMQRTTLTLSIGFGNDKPLPHTLAAICLPSLRPNSSTIRKEPTNDPKMPMKWSKN